MAAAEAASVAGDAAVAEREAVEEMAVAAAAPEATVEAWVGTAALAGRYPSPACTDSDGKARARQAVHSLRLSRT